jgi:hypothetical protein
MDINGKGIELDTKDFDGDWDYVYATRGTSSSVIITKYKCLKEGCLLPSSDWVVKSYYDRQWGVKVYREEKLQKLGI